MLKNYCSLKSFRLLLFLLALAPGSGSIVSLEAANRPSLTPKWDRFEAALQSKKTYDNPLQELTVAATLTSPTGLKYVAYAFWDGGKTWRFRFSPAEVGRWSYVTSCSDAGNKGLQDQTGEFICTAAAGKTRFSKHGPVRVSNDGFFLLHEDGEPFFWMADTVWNGALMSSSEDWAYYLRERVRQKFTAAQFVATQWRSAPNGNRFGQVAYTGREIIRINPAFFQEMDQKITKLNEAGMLAAVVMLWANGGGSHPVVNPGVALPESQAILLARYMTARWGAHQVSWILGGDGEYRTASAEKWLRIGRAVFGKIPHGPVTMHPGGMQWVRDEFSGETWYDMVGYQSGHGDDAPTLKWLTQGPPAQGWRKEPHLPCINLEPPYENHIAYQSRTRITPEEVRRAVYWSLLVAPTAGVSYGGHGVWGWDDGTQPPVDHPGTGAPLPWKKALNMPGAEQMAHVFTLFNSFDYWRLRPAQEMLAQQPGASNPAAFIAAARTEYGDAAVIYTPEASAIQLAPKFLPKNCETLWFNPRTGEMSQAKGDDKKQTIDFAPPSAGDWVLFLKTVI
jgi:hypothetical protein